MKTKKKCNHPKDQLKITESWQAPNSVTYLKQVCLACGAHRNLTRRGKSVESSKWHS